MAELVLFVCGVPAIWFNDGRLRGLTILITFISTKNDYSKSSRPPNMPFTVQPRHASHPTRAHTPRQSVANSMKIVLAATFVEDLGEAGTCNTCSYRVAMHVISTHSPPTRSKKFVVRGYLHRHPGCHSRPSSLASVGDVALEDGNAPAAVGVVLTVLLAVVP